MSNTGGSTRRCVFCGKVPDQKTNEHVLPRWLIELTGNPKRPMLLGPFMTKEQVVKEFSFDQFRFPACEACNTKYSELEGGAKQIMTTLLGHGPVSADEWNTLLDWFDKVRVGLWLGYHQYLDRNFWGVTPNFGISKRMGEIDRAVIVYRSETKQAHLSFSGVNTPAFAHSPTCFTLFVNDLAFTNVSDLFLLARRCGLAHPNGIYFNTESQTKVGMPFVKGTEIIEYPVLGYEYDKSGVVVAQPIFRQFLDACAADYSTPYVRALTLRDGCAKPLVQREKTVITYPVEATRDWLPCDARPHYNLVRLCCRQTLLIQSGLIDRVRLDRAMSKEQKRRVRSQLGFMRRTSRKLLSLLDEGEE